MVKIKTKKQFTLPQLIEWAWDNPESSKNKRFISENKENPGVKQYVIFNDFCYAEVENSYCYGPVDFFTVEVEEKITEDTKLDLIERFTVNNETYYTNPQTMSINTSLEAAPDYINITHFYVENDDRELVLIWRDGKLI